MVDDRKLHRKRDPASSSSSSESDSEPDRRKSKDKRKDRERSKRKKEKRKKKKRRHYSSDDTESTDAETEEERRKKKRLLKEAKRILKEHRKGEISAGHSEKKPMRKALSEDDYYEKNKEFSTWLKEERGIYFSNLSADDTRRFFSDFVDQWNAGKLSEKIYNGIDTAARSDYKWKIRKEEDASVDREEELEFMKKLEKAQRKKFQKEHEVLMDEILPKATGKERILEKKAIRREEARRREESPEMYRERDIMGGGDDFRQRLERERAWREKKAAEKSGALIEKQLAFEEKETTAMNHLKSLVDLAGGKITMRKRTD